MYGAVPEQLEKYNNKYLPSIHDVQKYTLQIHVYIYECISIRMCICI